MMNEEPLDRFVFSRPLTPTAQPVFPVGVLTRKDLEHASCRVCYRPLRRGDLCDKHAGRAS